MNGLALFLTVFLACAVEAVEALTVVLAVGTTRQWASALQGSVAALAALAVVVAALGPAVRTPLARVPENTMKFAVGTMLTAFGTFWAAEGAGATWPGSDAALLILVPTIAVLAAAAVVWLRRTATPATRPPDAQRDGDPTGPEGDAP
ncbi:hypothetical protein [Streptomyces sp. NBC_01306]|uniref:hypothetical protein n=1 Tax=Streptomyces sp. NBC_01306 TaxID=2903819 RepID=UPI00225086DC|nr:hypothetical protein [Streptomyces sp. NBC_01306]MCX4722954.1 hypothetical protein [Streptomyces sp. NBC_01306]